MRCSNRVMAWCFVWTVGFTLAVNTGSRAAEPGALPPQAELIFEDRFEKPELDPAWKVKVGQWRIIDGVLEAKGPDAFLLLKRDAGPSMRLEYTAWSDDPCDLSACLNLDATATRPAGIFFQFGGMYNKTTAVAYGNARLWEGAGPVIQKGVKHRVQCERWGVFGRFVVDGQVLFHGVIPGVDKNRNGFAGLFVYKSGRIADVKLYRFKGEPAGEMLRAEPDPKVRTWLSFENGKKGGTSQLPAGWSIKKGAGDARVVLVRDYKNSDPLPRWVEDRCLELALPSAGNAPRLEGAFEVRPCLPVQRAVDVEIGVELPLRLDGQERVLPLALSPGEGVVIELPLVKGQDDLQASKRNLPRSEARSTTVRIAGIVLKWIRADKEANFKRIEPLIR